MSTLTKPYVFTAGDYAVAAQVNANFDSVFNWINGGGAMWSDGTVSFSQVPSGPNTDPSAPNHLARKSYVDNLALNAVNSIPSGGLKFQAGSTVLTTNLAGDGTINFPTPFPNSLITVLVCTGDWSDAYPSDVSVVWNGATTGFNIHVDYKDAPQTNALLRFNWIAIGT